MKKLVSIDYGTKRCGLAISDELQIIGSPLKTVPTFELLKSLKQLAVEEELEGFVLGQPIGLKGESTDVSRSVFKFSQKLKSTFPELKVWMHDERFTSKLAFKAMIDGNLPKEKRKNKSIVDKVSAALILQSFIDQRTR